MKFFAMLIGGLVCVLPMYLLWSWLIGPSLISMGIGLIAGIATGASVVEKLFFS